MNSNQRSSGKQNREFQSQIAKTVSRETETHIWNFAIGSNLHPRKRTGRANLHIDELLPGKVKDWRLAFNLKGISWLEPSMAGVEPMPGEEVHGLLLRMRPREFAKLVSSEGENHAYRQVEVEVESYRGEMIRALAFSALDSRKLEQDRPPSLRYMELIRNGARLSGLDPSYIRKLDSLPYMEKNLGARLISVLLFDMIMCFGSLGKPQIGTSVFRILRMIDDSGNPAIMKFFLNIVFFFLIKLFYCKNRNSFFPYSFFIITTTVIL